MTFDEMMAAVLAILPSAAFGEDNDGQIIIYTNMRETGSGMGDGQLVDMG